jgi:hypothetical protein
MPLVSAGRLELPSPFGHQILSLAGPVWDVTLHVVLSWTKALMERVL